MFAFCWPRSPTAHACGAEPLIVQIIILIRNVTVACFILYTNQVRFTCFFSHFISLHAWLYCSTFLSSHVVTEPYIVSPTRLLCLVCINNPVFWSGRHIMCWQIHILNWADCNTFHARIMILVLDTSHFAFSSCHIISHRLPKCKFEAEFLFNLLPRWILGDISMHSSH